jgi:hypothetical protein
MPKNCIFCGTEIPDWEHKCPNPTCRQFTVPSPPQLTLECPHCRCQDYGVALYRCWHCWHFLCEKCGNRRAADRGIDGVVTCPYCANDLNARESYCGANIKVKLY